MIVGVDELLTRQDRLQAEAHEVMAALELPAVLGRIGRVAVIGSAATGLMVWRDLDVSVYADPAAIPAIADAVRHLVAHPDVLDVHYADETGARSPSGTHDQRHYVVVRYRDWKIDLSIWTDTGPNGEFSDAAAIRARLTDETRLAILRIKDVVARGADYPDAVSGIDVYDAVLNHGVRDVDGFTAHRGSLRGGCASDR